MDHDPSGARSRMLRHLSRFAVPVAGQAPVESSDGGLALAAVALDSGAVLALVADLEAIGLANAGASATNAIGEILAFFWPRLCRFLEVEEQDVIWVEWDSAGKFDALVPVRDPRHSLSIHPNWRPLRSGMTQGAGRELADFVALFGSPGVELVEMVRELSNGRDVQ